MNLKALLNLKNLIAVILCLASFFPNAKAQSKIEKGYIILNSGDTNSCYLYNQPMKFLQASVKVKMTEDGETSVYKPGQIKGFGFKDRNEHYEHKVFEYRYVLHRAGASITEEKDMVDEVYASLFLNKFSDGILRMYQFIDEKDIDHFFVQKDGGELHELYTETSVVNNKTTNYKPAVRRNDKYKGVLQVMLQDCQEIQKKVQSTLLSENSLKKLASNYSECIGEEINVGQEIQRSKLWITYNLGISYLPIYASTPIPGREYLENGDLKTKPFVTLGANFSFYHSKLSQRLFFDFGIRYQNYNFSGSHTEVINYGRYSEYDYEFSAHAFQVPMQIGYHINPFSKTSVYLKGGIYNALVLASKNDLDIYTVQYSSEFNESGYALGHTNEANPRQEALNEFETFGQTYEIGVIRKLKNQRALVFKLNYVSTGQLYDIKNGQVYAKGFSFVVGYRL